MNFLMKYLVYSSKLARYKFSYLVSFLKCWLVVSQKYMSV